MGSIWLKTEEAPKANVIQRILERFCQRNATSMTVGDKVDITPIWDDQKFTGEYSVTGISVKDHDETRIGLVHGTGAMVDYLLYDQEQPPTPTDKPIMAVEETKTQDNKSRNVSTGQRLTKFSAVRRAYGNDIDTCMLYNDNGLNPVSSKKPASSSIRGVRLMRTLDVDIVGAERYDGYDGYKSVDELIEDNKTPSSRSGNIPFTVTRNGEGEIVITAKLSNGKNKGISHDPNKGLIIGTANALRSLGYTGRIVVKNHDLDADKVSGMDPKNKFLQAAEEFGIELDGISMPAAAADDRGFWYPEESSEKVASILMETMALQAGYEHVFANHAGCERGYVTAADGSTHEVPVYKRGEGKIPDLVLYDRKNNHLIVVEGKKRSTLKKGKEELEKMGDFNDYLLQLYPNATIDTTISIFGGKDTAIPDPDVSFHLTKDMRLMCSPECSGIAGSHATPQTDKKPKPQRKTPRQQKTASPKVTGEGPYWVDSYVRSDGVKVKGHYRKRPHRK